MAAFAPDFPGNTQVSLKVIALTQIMIDQKQPENVEYVNYLVA
jgi:hypothetical protein